MSVAQMFPGVEVDSERQSRHADVLTPQAVEFAAELARKFRSPRELVLREREERRRARASGARPAFMEETAEIREALWTIGPSPIPSALQDRRVELVGTPLRDDLIEGLKCGAGVYVADFEAAAVNGVDLVEAQRNVRDALDGIIDAHRGGVSSGNAKKRIATLVIGPRDWYALEDGLRVDNEPVPATLFDFGLYFFHNFRHFLGEGHNGYLYLTNLESFREARLWSSVLKYAEDALGLPWGKIKVTAAIETVDAAFQMQEILHELRDHVVGLRCERGGYLASLAAIGDDENSGPGTVEARGDQSSRRAAPASAFAQLLVKTCHSRGAYAIEAIGPGSHAGLRSEVDERSSETMRFEADRAVTQGFDGVSVFDPTSVDTAMEVFERRLGAPSHLHEERGKLIPGAHDVFDEKPQGPNQLGILHQDFAVSADDLLKIPDAAGTKSVATSE